MIDPFLHCDGCLFAGLWDECAELNACIEQGLNDLCSMQKEIGERGTVRHSVSEIGIFVGTDESNVVHLSRMLKRKK